MIVFKSTFPYYQYSSSLISVHKLFNFPGNFEKCVTLLRDKNKSKDLAAVVQSIFSHSSVAKKNQLTIMLIVSRWSKVIFLSFD